jgi:hypothetical protein
VISGHHPEAGWSAALRNHGASTLPPGRARCAGHAGLCCPLLVVVMMMMMMSFAWNSAGNRSRSR